MKASDSPKTIDLEQVFKSKNPRLYGVLPGFLFRYLKRLIHQDEMNAFLIANKDKRDIEFAQAILDHFKIGVNALGLENIPGSGGCILASNHPIGSVDAMALITAVGRRRRDIKFLVNDVLMNLDNLSGIFVPVNKHGRNPQSALRDMETLYSSGQVILVFPAGLVSRRIQGKIRDLEWKKSFVTKAKKYGQAIIPAFISGRNSGFFYSLANLRKMLGINTNIEMFFLPNETFSQREKTITLIFGEPIRANELAGTDSDNILAEKIKQHVYRMGEAGKPLAFGD